MTDPTPLMSCTVNHPPGQPCPGFPHHAADLPGRTNSELEADVARLTAERDEARAHLINLVQVGWLGPYGLIPSGMGSSWRGWADMDNDPAPNWVPVYRFATQEATALAAHDDPSAAIDVVNEQAEDEGLWFVAKTMPEAYLQQELRRLHAAVEAG